MSLENPTVSLAALLRVLWYLFTRCLIVVAVVVSLPLVVITVAYFVYPGALLEWFYVIRRAMVGLSKYHVIVEGKKMVYTEGSRRRTLHETAEEKEAMVLLHGFTATKDNWDSLVKHLTPYFHVICLDLPGHGDSFLPEEALDMHQFVEWTYRAVSKIGVGARKPFHLVGLSMGGQIAGLYARKHPHHVKTLTLMCPAGVRTPVASHMSGLMDTLPPEEMPLIPRTPEQFQAMLELVSAKPLKVPHGLMKHLASVNASKHPFLSGILDKMKGLDGGFSLHRYLGEIECPTLVLWGSEDKVLHVSGAAEIRKKVKECRVKILEGAGHSLVMEQPEAVASEMYAFLADTGAEFGDLIEEGEDAGDQEGKKTR